MASIRRLKKDIQYLSAQLIGDCLDFIDDSKEGKNEKIMTVIEEAVALNNSTIEKVCHPEGKDNPKLIKTYYSQLKKDFIKGLDENYKKLEKLIKK